MKKCRSHFLTYKYEGVVCHVWTTENRFVISKTTPIKWNPRSCLFVAAKRGFLLRPDISYLFQYDEFS